MIGRSRHPCPAVVGCLVLTMWFGMVGLAAQQETEPLLTVETVGIEPTVAMTGDILIATYRVRFQDLIAQGKEIVVVEDRMTPDKLPLVPFEALGLDVDKQQIGQSTCGSSATGCGWSDRRRGSRRCGV